MQGSGFLRRHALTILTWPAVGGILIALTWAITLSLLQQDYRKVRAAVVQQSQSLSRAYAEQLRRTVDQIDRITLGMKYARENAGDAFDLARQSALGLVAGNAGMAAAILDREGRVVASTGSEGGMHVKDTAALLRRHMNAERDALLITGGHAGPELPQAPIVFSRAIDAPDGRFAGVALISVRPNYLVSFYDVALLGSGDFITVRSADGNALATHLGEGSATRQLSYRSAPVFLQSSGVRSEAGERFRDNAPRIVAWNRLDDYPLVALAALSETNAFAAYRASERRTLATATIASVILFLFASVGMVLSARLAWRRQQAEEVKETYRLAVDAAREGFYMLRPLLDARGCAVDFQFADCNERAANLIGISRMDLLGLRLSQVYRGDLFSKALAELRVALKNGFQEEEIRVPPGSPVRAEWVHRRAVRTRAGLAVTMRDVSEAYAQQEALATLANVDAVTGLPNRHWLGNFLPRALEQARAGEHHLAVLFIDLDDFKDINDTLGHATGDEVLKAVSLRLKSLVRATDQVVRLGGDEFAVLLQQVQRVDDVVRVAHLIVNGLSEPFALGAANGHAVQASVGISMFPDDGEDGLTLLKHADIAMYAAKAAGKARYHFYHSHLSDSLRLRISREQALRQAIERDEFVLHYQPRVDTASGRLLSVEALLRWVHSERGMVPPLEFIEVAEETGLILRLGRMVVEKACAQIAQWKAQGLPVVPVSINVSALQFNSGRVKDMLADCMERYGVEPELIGVELTESCMAGQDETVAGELDGLRALGVKLLVDDFGTGYSSLSQLQRLNVDILKVDRAFTITLADSEEGKALFKAIVSMAEALGIGIVAEGVETCEQLRVLQSLNCDEVQGYFVSQPVPAAEMAGLMLRRFLFPANAPRTSMESA